MKTNTVILVGDDVVNDTLADFLQVLDAYDNKLHGTLNADKKLDDLLYSLMVKYERVPAEECDPTLPPDCNWHV